MQSLPLGRARLLARPALRRHQAAEVTPAFICAIEHALRRADRLRLAALPLLTLQSAPPGFDPDAEALAPGSDSRRCALRLWRLPADALARGICINALREDVRGRATTRAPTQPRPVAAQPRQGPAWSAPRRGPIRPRHAAA